MFKLDLKDRKLLYWLDQNSRATNKELGRNVGLTEQAIGYRIKRLVDRGIVKKFVTFVNTLALGYQHYKVFLKLHGTTEEDENAFIKSLVDNPNIRWVVSMSGRYDASFSVLARTPAEFSAIYQAIEAKYGQFIVEKIILINIRSPGFTREYLVDGKQSKLLEYASSRELQETDDIDGSILKSISQDSRKNVVDIAKEINATADIVKYRLKKLKEKSIISGFTLQLDLEKLGYEYYSIFLYLHNMTESVEKSIITFAQMHPAVRFVAKLIGSHDLQLELEVKNHEELDKIMKEFRQQFSANIRDFEILRVTKEYKYDFYPFTKRKQNGKNKAS
jgi:DNA-binding Lrp family transcriptional regulator